MSMMIVGTGVSNAPVTPNSAPATHSTSSASLSAGGSVVGPPPAHMTQLTSAPVIGSLGQATAATVVPLGHRAVLDHHTAGAAVSADPQPAHHGSPNNMNPSAASTNVATMSSAGGFTYGGSHGAGGQPLPQVLTQHHNSSLAGSGPAGSPGGASFGHSLPQPCNRPISGRPLQSPSGRALTNGLQSRPAQLARPASLTTGRTASSAGGARSFVSSRPGSGGGQHQAPPHPPPAQHHLPQAPQPRESTYAPRSMPMSPQRQNPRPRSQSSSRVHNYGGGVPGASGGSVNASSIGAGSSGSLPLMAPSPAHHLFATSVNSPSLIPQNIPHQSFLPQIPIQLTPAGPSSPQYRVGSPQCRVSSPMPASDNAILPPNEFKKFTRSVGGADDEGDQHEHHANIGRRNLISPRQRERRNFFNHVSLQDHNYCAAPPPSPPRSPTPPLSPYIPSVPPAGSSSMGAAAQSSQQPPQQQQHHVPDQQHHPPHHHHHNQPVHHNHQESFSFGIANYKDGVAVFNKDAAGGGSSSGQDKSHHHAQSAGPAAPGGNGPLSLSSGGGKESTSTVGAYPSPHYSGNTGDCSPLSRLKQTIEDAGVGPMTPLGHEGSPLRGDKSVEPDESPDSRPSPDRDGGEETETAPEAEDEGADDAVTRCICDYLHDDGYMICCDKCSVWQHVVCMFIDKDNIPDEYLCEKCQPRPVDKKRAKNLQKAREKEIFKTLPIDSSEDERKPVAVIPKGRKAAIGAKKTFGSGGLKKGSGGVGAGLGGVGAGSALVPEKKVEKKLSKKPVKRRTLKETLTGVKADRKVSPRKNQRRKSASATDIETEEENANDASALRSWIDTYEEAVTNHYSPELRARLQGVKLPSTQFKPKEVNGIRCNVSLRGNGVKVLTANSYIPANTPIIECRGKYMLASQLSSRARSSEFVLLHRISPELEVCVDCKTYGNDSRFCRRAESEATKFNAEVKHHLDKGSLHLYIVSTRTIDKNQEILLGPLDHKSTQSQPQLSIQDELRQIKKVNGLIDEKKSRKTSSVKQRRLKREVKKELCDSSSDEDMPVTMRKTRSNVEKQTDKSVNFNLSSSNNLKKEVKTEDIKEEKDIKKEKDSRITEKENKVTKAEKKVKAEPDPEIKQEKVKQEPKVEIKEEKEEPVLQKPLPSSEKDNDKVSETPQVPAVSPGPKSEPPGAATNAAKSPGKPVLGLPDQSGLIVGVNTINYDVSLRNKSMSREEKKMEMILKAIAAMEKAESRKKNDSGDGATERVPAKRRRSNSNKKEHGAGDSNIDSSCDETGLDVRPERPRAPKGKRKRNISVRRRSRAKSGDSTSAMSADESTTTPNIENESSSTPSEGAPFKFPFKKQQDGDDVEDDVSGHYIRGSKSPPGIANHLLRSAVTNHAGIKSPTKSIGCSAKKRWLRAAMSEDHSEENQAAAGGGGGGGAGSSPALSSGGGAGASPGQEPDYTPLKKRRLATYNESTEEKEAKPEEQEKQEDKLSKNKVTEKFKSLPNGLKKRLISNLLLNAVLDNAIQDILPDQDLAPSPTELEGGSPAPAQEEAKEKESLESKQAPETPNKPAKKSRSVRKGVKSKKSVGEPEENGLDEESPGASDSVTAEKKTEKTDKTDSQKELEKNETVEDDKTKDVIEDDTKVKERTATTKPDPVTTKTSATTTAVATTSEKPREPDSEKPPTPIQHSVFKSFFSTDLSIDDIDRQIEAKRVELARENSLATSLPSPRLDFDNLPSRSSLRSELKPLLTAHSVPQESSASTPSTPTTTRKKVSIADYKKRKQANLQQQGENQTDSAPSNNPSATSSSSRISSFLSTPITSLPPVSLPELPGLATTTTSSVKQKSTAPLFQPKRTRSNSPLSNDKKGTRGSPLSEKRNSRGSTPQESRTRSGSPLEKKGVSPAKGRDRTGSPRRTANSYLSSSQKHDRWDSKSLKDRDSHKALKQNSPFYLGKRVPVSTPVLSTQSMPAAPPNRPTIHTPDMPREDLTERLRKEFGLNIEDSEGEDGSDSDSGVGGGGDFPGSGLRRAAAAHNGPERTNGWREEDKSGGGGYWGQR